MARRSWLRSGRSLTRETHCSDPDAHEVVAKACQSISELVGAGPAVEQGLRPPRRRLASSPTTRTLSRSHWQQGSIPVVEGQDPAQAAAVFEAFAFDAKACESMVVYEQRRSHQRNRVCLVDDDVFPAYGTITILRETKLHLHKKTSSTVCRGRQAAARLRSGGPSRRRRWRVFQAT